MTIRSLLLTSMLLLASTAAALAQTDDEVIAAPTLRASVTVSADVVRIGDVIDNAGSAAQIAIYRAPDLGTTGALPTAQLIAVLRTHQVIGVDTRNLTEIQVTRLARTLETKDIELQVARALERRNGLGEAANLSLTFDRDVQDLRLDTSNSGAIRTASARYEPRSGRFDVTFEIANDNISTPTRLRFTGRAVETIEAAVLTRDIDRNELLKASDLVIERRPKAEVGPDATTRDRALGMQSRRPIRAGQALRVADLSKPDLVQRDMAVTLIYETAGLYLTVRGKALEAGTEGDVVNVMNLQSKRTVSGVVVGRGQISISVATPRLPAAEAAPAVTVGSTATAAPAVVASSTPATPKVE